MDIIGEPERTGWIFCSGECSDDKGALDTRVRFCKVVAQTLQNQLIGVCKISLGCFPKQDAPFDNIHI